MSSVHSVKFELASRYGLALFAVAEERKELEKVGKELQAFSLMRDSSKELSFMLNCPTIPRSEKVSAIMAIADKAGFSKTTKDFLGLVAGNNRLFALPDMIKAFLGLIEEKEGQVTVEVTSALELAKEQKEKISSELSSALGKTIRLQVKEDASLLGGMMVKVGSLIDSSLKTKVQQLKLAMKGAQ